MSGRRDTVQVYRRRERGEVRWRWRYIHWNGRILADSGQSYARKCDAINGADVVIGVRRTSLDGIRWEIS